MKKLFGILNIVDIILICVIVLAVITGIYKFTASTQESERIYDNAVFTFVCESVPESVVKDIATGQTAVDHISGTALGEIIEAFPGSAMNYSPDSQGAVTLSGKPGYKAINIKTEVSCARMQNGYQAGDTLYLTGQSLMLRAGDALLPVYIAEIAL